MKETEDPIGYKKGRNILDALSMRYYDKGLIQTRSFAGQEIQRIAFIPPQRISPTTFGFSIATGSRYGGKLVRPERVWRRRLDFMTYFVSEVISENGRRLR
jgi:hypothetical protein